MTLLPRTPVLLDSVVDDPDKIRSLVAAHAPYWPVQRYFANSAEYATISGSTTAGEMVVGPVFRGELATDGVPADDDLRWLLELDCFADAARRLYSAQIVRPQTVYVNLTLQLPFPQGAGHTDVPAFRGFDRRQYPIAFLTIMGLSGLFEDVRVKVATAVAWFYRGSDGGFEYWPNGPDQPSLVHEGAIDNTAVVADNDFMWHRVRPTGSIRDGMPTLTLDSELIRVLDGWEISDGGGTAQDRFGDDELRVSLSWKAVVFDSDADRRRHDEHTADIDLNEVLERFRRDLGDRGIAVEIPAEPVRDPAFIDLLHATYVRHPDRVIQAN